MPTAHRGSDRIFVWMCLLVFVYELGFGSVVPALALYARSFGVSQVSVGRPISAALLVMVGLAFARLAPETARYASIR